MCRLVDLHILYRNSRPLMCNYWEPSNLFESDDLAIITKFTLELLFPDCLDGPHYWWLHQTHHGPLAVLALSSNCPWWFGTPHSNRMFAHTRLRTAIRHASYLCGDEIAVSLKQEPWKACNFPSFDLWLHFCCWNPEKFNKFQSSDIPSSWQEPWKDRYGVKFRRKIPKFHTSWLYASPWQGAWKTGNLNLVGDNAIILTGTLKRFNFLQNLLIYPTHRIMRDHNFLLMASFFAGTLR